MANLGKRAVLDGCDSTNGLQGLHDELGKKEVELQSLMMHTQSLEEELEKRDQEFADLQTDLHEVWQEF